ncbi:MAG: endolytic transglycosylase MltG [Patescibacteria group bacterium]
MELNKKNIAVSFFILFFILFFLISYASGIPKNFPSTSSMEIAEGSSLKQIGNSLEEKGYIRSNFAFTIFATLMGLERKLKSGEYFFSEPEPLIKIISRISWGDYGFKIVKVMIPEGSTNQDIAELFKDFDNFNKENFLKTAERIEGYLFPDTYFLTENVNAEKVKKILNNNFYKRIEEIGEKISNNSRNFFDVMIMASLIEKEVADQTDRKIVSGILWKRLDKGMPLQVDAEYNTYHQKGLPPQPICNPGLDAIIAALEPEDSPYWYYLSDKKGITHFAKDFEIHKRNKAKYLKR